MIKIIFYTSDFTSRQSIIVVDSWTDQRTHLEIALVPHSVIVHCRVYLYLPQGARWVWRNLAQCFLVWGSLAAQTHECLYHILLSTPASKNIPSSPWTMYDVVCTAFCVLRTVYCVICILLHNILWAVCGLVGNANYVIGTVHWVMCNVHCDKGCATHCVPCTVSLYTGYCVLCYRCVVHGVLFAVYCIVPIV